MKMKNNTEKRKRGRWLAGWLASYRRSCRNAKEKKFARLS